MSIQIIDSLFLGSDLPLDARSVVSFADDVSKYWHAGFTGFETSTNLPFYIDGSLNVNYFLTANGYLTDSSLGPQFRIDPTLDQYVVQPRKGTTFPVTDVSEGDTYYRTDAGLGYQYDGSRGKWLSINRKVLNCGRSSAAKNADVYMEIGSAVQSSITGFRMFKHGTVTSVSIDNGTVVTDAGGRDLEIRINDTSTQILNIPLGESGNFSTGFDLDYNAGDQIQAILTANNTDTLSQINVIIEIADRE